MFRFQENRVWKLIKQTKEILFYIFYLFLRVEYLVSIIRA